MGHTNNIFGIRINTIMSNGSVNFGNVWHTNQQANIKMNVGYYQAGDANNSPLRFENKNYAFDSDVVDQPQQQV
ncbi:spore germination protein [Gracilibacillus lacisalsi]|uniref:spore germination protein n=1 Tax=Gracilibacillus lacisalsi TaxID=393087 RepID=UPI00038263E9|nr:spore germination protein [Gracilibacillus lacisalsi]